MLEIYGPFRGSTCLDIGKQFSYALDGRNERGSARYVDYLWGAGRAVGVCDGGVEEGTFLDLLVCGCELW